MFKEVSMAGSGVVVLIFAEVIRAFGYDVDRDTLASFVDSLFTFIGAVLLLWGQLRRKDLDYGLFRK